MNSRTLTPLHIPLSRIGNGTFSAECHTPKHIHTHTNMMEHLLEL